MLDFKTALLEVLKENGYRIEFVGIQKKMLKVFHNSWRTDAVLISVNEGSVRCHAQQIIFAFDDLYSPTSVSRLIETIEKCTKHHGMSESYTGFNDAPICDDSCQFWKELKNSLL
jgi:hypothetical protein